MYVYIKAKLPALGGFAFLMNLPRGRDDFMKKMQAASISLIWFGAGISIAEILTGTFIAPLGFVKGTAAILLGHFIGFILIFMTGLIGGKTGKSSMETVKISFGGKGAAVFAALNIFQLAGWTAIMLENGAASANSVFGAVSTKLWSIIIGILIIIWVVMGIKKLDRVNYVTMTALFILTVIMSFVIPWKNAVTLNPETISFGAAVELAVAMPLSWLPLISDYTRAAKKPVRATFAASGAYFIASTWMYLIGMGAAIFTGESDIALIMTKAGLGIAALIVVIFSTVTTTFLDVYSAGVSCKSLHPSLKEKPSAVIVCVAGMALALFTPVTEMESFLYIIGSVFAPMAAILITDYFILKKDCSEKNADTVNIIIWVAGFVLYRIFMHIDTPVGYTLPAMIIISLCCIAVNKSIGYFKNDNGGKKNA